MIKRGGGALIISQIKRIFFYLKGINRRIQDLTDYYFLEKIDISDGDVIIDVGANIGEIGYILNNTLDKKINYHSFEPAIKELHACSKNNPQGKNNNFGLWKTKDRLKFYNKNTTGDSSFFVTNQNESVTHVNVDTLDNYVKEKDIKNIKLLKLEAEGAEPEVLKGAINSLPVIEYITADLGYERGIEEKQTFTIVTNMLLENGFEIIDIYPLRLTALYKNKLL